MSNTHKTNPYPKNSYDSQNNILNHERETIKFSEVFKI